MSVDQIPPQGAPFVYEDPDGNQRIDSDWYMFLYSLWISTTSILDGGVSFPDAVKIAMVDLDAIGADVANAHGGGGSLTITELDGVPSVAATSLVLPNGTLSVLGTVATYTPAASASTFPKGAAWDGGGTLSAVIAGSTNVIFPPRAQAAGTILGAYAIASGVGSCTVEVWKSAAGTVPTAANKISGSAPIALAAAQSSVDTTLTGWTTAVALGDQFAFKLLTCAALTWAEVYVLIG